MLPEKPLMLLTVEPSSTHGPAVFCVLWGSVHTAKVDEKAVTPHSFLHNRLSIVNMWTHQLRNSGPASPKGVHHPAEVLTVSEAHRWNLRKNRFVEGWSNDFSHLIKFHILWKWNVRKNKIREKKMFFFFNQNSSELTELKIMYNQSVFATAKCRTKKTNSYLKMCAL